ncbi:VPDSG-CTERM sorting domain-containing protein [Limisphaera sp. VF-2]|uniref:VPDSG-CTERM sorting domain-containing protein n=1 Tax=Limisphaera sp. VF-2 TaxID=3400418 RepID=UPI003C165F9D
MKTTKLAKTLVAAAAALLVAGQASATLVTVVRTAGYYDPTYGGGEFTLKGSPWANPAHYALETLVDGGFQTFCLEVNEFLSGQPLLAVLNTVAVMGGKGGGSPDPLSIGSAWLYKQFAEGNLAGYDYTPGAGREASARALQETIWWLEDEQTSLPSDLTFYNLVIAKFGSAAAAKQDYTVVNPNYRVAVINLWGKDDQGNWTVPKQDMLVYLPDGGVTLVLLGSGLVGLAVLRRKG